MPPVTSPASAQWWLTSRYEFSRSVELVTSTRPEPPGPFMAMPLRTNVQLVQKGRESCWLPRRYVLRYSPLLLKAAR